MVNSRFEKKVIIAMLSFFAFSFLLSLALMQLIAGFLFLMWLSEKKEEKSKTVGLIFYAIIIFGLVRLISVFLSDFPSESYKILYKEVIFYITAVTMSFYYKALDKDDIMKVMNIFILGAIIVTVIGIYRFYAGDVERAQSFSGSYTVFSTYLLVAFSFSLFLTKNYSGYSKQVLWAIVYSVLFLGIFTSLGRANLFIAILIFLISVFLKQIKPLQFIIFFFVVVVLLLSNVISPSEKIQQRAANITQLSDRDVIWEGAWKIKYEKPVIGFGPRTFSQIFPLKEKLQDKGVGGWHNDFLQIYFESGIIGLLSFLLLIFFIIKKLISHIRFRNLHQEYRSFSNSILFAVISLILTSFFSGFITSVYLSIVFVFLIALIDRISLEEINLEKI
jgi:O-antigen ligase